MTCLIKKNSTLPKFSIRRKKLKEKALSLINEFYVAVKVPVPLKTNISSAPVQLSMH